MTNVSQPLIVPFWKTSLAGFLIMGLYGLALLFPEPLWGLHYPAFLPLVGKALLFGIGISLLLLPMLVAPEKWGSSIEGMKIGRWNRVLPYGLALFMGLLFWQLPIASDFYGDAREISQNLDGKAEVFNPAMLRDSLLPIFDMKTGVFSFYALISLLGYLFDANLLSVLAGFNAVLGAIFVLLWLRLVRAVMVSRAGRILMGAIGLTSPALQIYFGHIETYALPLTLNLAFVTALVLFFQSHKRKYFWCLLPLLYFCIKFSITSILLCPLFLLALVYFLAVRKHQTPQFWTWKQLLLRILLPGLALGLLVYIFLTQSVLGGRMYTETTVMDVIFLPVMASDAAPLDRYNLFSLSHLWDYFNMWFLWSAPGLMLIGTALIFRRRLDWSQAPLKVLLTGSIIYFLFFFVLNPLLGMQNDWDLMSLPVPVFLGLALLLAGQLEQQGLVPRLLGPGIGLALLGISTFWVNSKLDLLANRQEVVGSHNFKTYYIGSITSWKCALDAEPDPDKRLQRLERLLASNKSAALPGIDPEYAFLHYRMGEIYQEEKRQLPQAVEHYLAAREYAPFFGINLNRLVGAYFYLKDYEKADQYAEEMIAYPYPDLPTALRAGVQVAVHAGKRDRARSRAEALLRIDPQDVLGREVIRQLDAGASLGAIKQVIAGNGKRQPPPR